MVTVMLETPIAIGHATGAQPAPEGADEVEEELREAHGLRPLRIGLRGQAGLPHVCSDVGGQMQPVVTGVATPGWGIVGVAGGHQGTVGI